MSIFLTDGRAFLGPYEREDPFTIAQAKRWLQPTDSNGNPVGTAQIWAVEAPTVEEARTSFRQHRH